jgi:hypothetical protein
MTPAIESAWWVLRLALGLGPLIAGADKFYVLARLTEAREAQPASVAVA